MNMEDILELYAIEVFTGDSRGCGDAVSVVLEGDRGTSHKIQLKADCGHINKLFKKNKIDEFHLVTEELGNLTKIIVYNEGRMRHSWFCDKIHVMVKGRTYLATFSKWMDQEMTATLELICSRGPIILGPILRLRGCTESLWQVSAMIVTESSQPIGGLTYVMSQRTASVGPKFIVKLDNCTLWRYDLDIKLTDKSEPCIYRIGGQEYNFRVPARDEQPRMLFGSNMDVKHPYHQSSTEDKSLMWNYIDMDHRTNGYHLLLLGGDQVHCDGIFMCSPSFQEWSSQGTRERSRQIFTPRMKAEAQCYYSKIYLKTWNQGAIPAIFSQIPTVMMWDDDDIYGGFGNFDPSYGTCPVLAGLFPFARRAFFNFQQQGDGSSAIHKNLDQEVGPFSRGFLLPGNVALLAMDVRSERFMRSHWEGQVLSPESWRDLKDWFQQIRQSEVRHLFVMSAVAVIRPHRNVVDRIVELFNLKKGEKRDPWPSRIHGSEGIFLLNLLSRFASGEHGRSKVTILAGDSRSMSQSIVEDPRGRIQIKQIVSSALGETRPNLSRGDSFKLRGKFSYGNFRGKMVKMPSGQWSVPAQNFAALVPRQQSYVGTWISRPNQFSGGKTGEDLPPPLTTDVTL
eukprot:TRINITY_DN2018_c0_g1_i1.p1 TRINITY_DN2018_c0_g1~~TRINITY_DN2018_c0_g1_i1.p1  ORF type:complete len:623 (-),score=179.38 TRINITY_DN2018_c0_g1_i1:57-1925(-)